MTGVDVPSQIRRLRPWLVPVAAVLCALAVLWAAGGLRSVEATQGRREEPGAEIELTRWVFVFHGMELVDPSPDDRKAETAVRLQLRATFTGQASTYGVGSQLITVSGLSGPVGVDDSPLVDGDRSSGFDPDVSQEITLTYRWPKPPAEPPTRLRVLLRDEEEKENYLFGKDWSLTTSVTAHLDLPCPDRRAG